MTDALERLIEAVAAGTLTGEGPVVSDEMSETIDAALPYNNDRWPEVVGAHDGLMDDALCLLEVLLPDHDWGRAPGGQMWVQRPPAAPVWSGDGYPPARGLLLTILRAYAGERVNEAREVM